MINIHTNSIYLKTLVGLVIIIIGILFSTAALFALGFITNSLITYLGFELKQINTNVFMIGVFTLMLVALATSLICLLYQLAESLGKIALKHYGKSLRKE